ncbi:RHS repeat-associated core domain-containing protein [candidate division WOR-3 bacterium]|nr:RHS repeat-associated core domain-containing protein [candidate division WOR-3 bacterium]
MNKKEIHSPLVITKGWPYQTIAKEYKYKAFGEMKYESGTYDNTHKFTGKEEDGTGLYYFGARYYDKAIGRWLVLESKSYPKDLKLDNPQSINAYSYCINNPLSMIDKDGRAIFTVGAAVGTGVVVGIGMDYVNQQQGSGMGFVEYY